LNNILYLKCKYEELQIILINEIV